MKPVTAIHDRRALDLVDVAANLHLAQELSPSECAAIIVQAATVQAACGARVAALGRADDYALTVDEAAAMLSIKRETLWKKVEGEPRYQALLVDTGSLSKRFSYRKVQAMIGGGGNPR